MQFLQTKKTTILWLRNNKNLFSKILATIILLLICNYTLIAQANTQYGLGALNNITTGSYNTANGYNALYHNTTGIANTANGSNVLVFNTTGSGNTASGDGALYNNTGNYNSAFGHRSLYNNNTGSGNTATGTEALRSNTTAYNNTASGIRSLYYNTTGSANTANGTDALGNNNIGNSNTALGTDALRNNTTGSNNTALGTSANVASGNLSNATAIGYSAIVYASNTIQLGNSSVTKVFAGTGATATLVAGGLQITGGSLAAGKVLTSDANGVASWQAPISGGGSGWSLTGNSGTVDGTTFIGTTDNVPFNIRVNNQKAGRIDPALFNTFYGYRSGNANTTASLNTANGYYALSSNTTGSLNTANGSQALYSNITGYGNTANGGGTLFSNTTGNLNTVYGYNSGDGITTGSRNTIIGANVIGLPADLSNTIILADGSGNKKLYINNSGNVGIGTTNPTHKLSVNGAIRAKEISVNTGWSDFVFDDNYKLCSLTEVEQFIKTNKHLPEIPSQQEVEKNGVQLGDISSKLLMKIEELTLYMIEIKKENQELRNQLNQLKH